MGWYLLFILLGFGASYFLYFYRKHTTNKSIRILLFFLRGLALSLLLSLLLSPLIKSNSNKEIKPKTVFIVDNSISNKNSESTIKEKLKKFVNSEDFEIYNLSGKIEDIDSIKYDLATTNLSNALVNAIEDNSSVDNLKTIYLLSDGNYNSGINPIYVSNPQKVKINSIVCGDTSHYGDFAIDNVDYNPVNLTKETIKINVSTSAYNTNKKNTSIALYRVDKSREMPVSSKNWNINSAFNSTNNDFTVEHSSPGYYHYRVKVAPDVNEKNTQNNVYDFYIEVIDDNKKVYIIYNSPHPDVSMIRDLLSKNQKFDVKLFTTSDKALPSTLPDLAILYQIPSLKDQNSDKWITWTKSNSISTLFIVGTMTDKSRFNTLNTNYTAYEKGNYFQDYFPVYNDKFSEFLLNKETISLIPKLAPLSNTLMDVKSVNKTETLIYSKVSNVVTSSPMISFSSNGNQKIGVILGENLWKWRVIDYKYNKNWNQVSDLLFNITNYLAIKPTKNQLITNATKKIYKSYEQVQINATTYNDVFQNAKASSINCEISNGKQTIRKEMIAQDNHYIFRPNGLNAGDYTYTVTATINGKNFISKGQFNIVEDQLENPLQTSNYNDMKNLAIQNSGEVMLLDRFESIPPYSDKDISIVKETKTEPFIDKFWGLFLILLLLGIEWLVRKYYAIS